MAEPIIAGTPGLQPTKEVYEAELRALRAPGALERRLEEIDRLRPFRRIYVMGCARSGTWVLTHVMGTLGGLDVVRRELEVAHFGLLFTREPALAFKRNASAHATIRDIPERIEIACIVRHPFDVLTSHLPGTGRLYHVSPERWLGEMDALRFLVETPRRNATVIRYEDLAAKPVETQAGLARAFGLPIAVPIEALRTGSTNPTEGPRHRDRTLDADSIHKHRRDPAKLAYLREIRPALEPALAWVGARFGYDLSLAGAADG